MQTGLGVRIAQGVVAISTALAILAVTILPFLTPAWVGFEQGRTGVGQAVRWCPDRQYGPCQTSDANVRVATDAILADLVLGPPDFDVAIDGQPVLKEPERDHMRDVRGVFASFYIAAAVGIGVLVAAFVRRPWRPRAWRAIRAGTTGLAAALVVGGVVATVAFDAAFEVFHRLFFSAGTYTFDPRTDKLVQLFPDQFWSETTIAVGAVAFVIAAGVAILAGRRMRASGSDVGSVAVPTTANGMGVVG